MPFPRTWLPRLRSILATVQASPQDQFDREAVVQLFALQRRAALSLMQEVGPTRLRTGRWVLARETLLAFLHSQQPEADVELNRKQRFSQSLLEADASLPRRPSILLAPRKLSPEQQQTYAAGLTEGVALEPGSPNRLVVEFTTLEQLAERLIATGLALNHRFDAYQQLLEPPSQKASPEDLAEQQDAEYFKNWRPE